MELDPKIRKGFKPLDCYDAETAKKYIGKRGFFFDTLDGFTDLSGRCVYDVLESIDDSFCPFYSEGTQDFFNFFLPEEFSNNHYRPYTLAEFLQEFSLSKPVKFRQKSTGNIHYQILLGYSEYAYEDDENLYVTLGTTEYTLQNLFEKYEVFKDGAFRPFGIQGS